ncbi:MAG: tetratricopeptide repeat-containing serine protease family protein [Dissulfurispiraceae bacterium]
MTFYIVSFFVLLTIISVADAKIPDVILEQRDAILTVSVQNKNGKTLLSGTGFIVTDNGIIVTSCNIIEKWAQSLDYTLTVEREEGSRFPIDLLLSRKCIKGVALFTVRAAGLPTVKLSPDNQKKVGDHIAILRKSAATRTLIVDGAIKSIQGKNGPFQLSTPFGKEDSGSPVFNMRGEVIGMVTISSQKKQVPDFAVPMEYVTTSLATYKRQIKGPTSSEALPSPRSPEITPLNESAPLSGKLENLAMAQKEIEKYQDDAKELSGLESSYAEFKDKTMSTEATQTYRKIVQIKHAGSVRYVNLGLAYYRLSKYSDAIEAFNRALELEPDAEEVYNKLGTIYIILGDYSTAVNTFKRALMINSRIPDTHFNLGLAYFLQGDKNAALNEDMVLKELDNNLANKLEELMY